MTKLVEELVIEDAHNFRFIINGKFFISIKQVFALFFSNCSFIFCLTKGKLSIDNLIGRNSTVALRVACLKLGQLLIPTNMINVDKIEWSAYFYGAFFDDFIIWSVPCGFTSFLG